MIKRTDNRPTATRRLAARRRVRVSALLVLLSILGLSATLPAVSAARPHRDTTRQRPVCAATRWIESWEAAPSDAVSTNDARLVPFAHGPQQTLRMIITPHYGGSVVRIRLSNRFSATPMTVNRVVIARSRSGAALVPGSSRAVPFTGSSTITIPAGAEAVSGPVHFKFRAFQNLAVSMYLQGSYIPTEHFTGRQISYGTQPGAGDHATDPRGSAFTQTTTARYVLGGLDVRAAGDAGTVVAFGDSLTDGYQGGPSLVPETTSTLNLNARYPDFLARRLLAAHIPLSVANAGISGNRILQNGQNALFGPSGLSRFTRDAIDVPGVSTIIIFEGANDIGQSNATAAQIIGGLTRLVKQARAAHIHVLLGTLTPMADAKEPGTYSGAAANATRLAVNAWIRSQHLANGDIDFAKAVEDPADPSTMLPADNGGDGLHFTPAGYRAMADAIHLTQLRTPECTQK